jgi:hypothetical protein
MAQRLGIQTPWTGAVTPDGQRTVWKDRDGIGERGETRILRSELASRPTWLTWKSDPNAVLGPDAYHGSRWATRKSGS